VKARALHLPRRDMGTLKVLDVIYPSLFCDLDVVVHVFTRRQVTLAVQYLLKTESLEVSACI
jgi:hypothetical protein